MACMCLRSKHRFVVYNGWLCFCYNILFQEEPPAEHQYARKRTRERLSKTPKLDCGAKLHVRETLCFPYEKAEKGDRRKRRKYAAGINKALGEGRLTEYQFERRFIVSFPRPEDHLEHPTAKDMPSTTLEVEEHQVSAPVADRDSSGTASAVDQKRVLRSRSKEEPPAEHQYARKRTRERLSKTPKLDCGAKLHVRETLCFPYEKVILQSTCWIVKNNKVGS
ncbi:uncharacterized protein LOC125372443 [Haliotis rufescens]|uniref:uncharacterized protein LOC124120968 n=1 Tax=Haliotis rufescens TaxID=6454 RepID=UPI00201F2031|nr:uncharacterized protein LOC124120968 [Haliotis rufescens]XP_048238454.1 uncharacterized protein LOC125372443 [Haliotis rufescens]